MSQAAAVRQTRMTLGSVKKGRIDKPVRVLLYGPEGVGKSTFGANAPEPIFLAAEDGTAQLDVARFPEPRTWGEAFEAIETLRNEEHPYRTLVVDTVDWLEPMCWDAVCEKAPKDKQGRRPQSIEDFGFGKGYTAALDEWRRFLAAIEGMRNARGMNVVMLAHSWTKTFKNPEDEDYDRYELKLHAKAGGLLKEWCDAVLFARFETFANTDTRTKRTRGISTGARVIHTQRAAAYDAKNRYDLPPTIPLDWQAFHDATKAHRPASPEQLVARIEKLLEAADDVLRARVRAAVQKASSDAAQLAKIHNHLSAQMQIAAQENAR